MFGFPINLQDSGVQKFTNDADSGFPKIQQKEVFYSIKDGLWNDTSIWQTVSGRVGLLPTIYDDVYIRNNVSIFSPPTINIRNLYITGNLVFTNGSVVLNVNNVFCDTGILDMTVGSQLNIRGNESRITKDRFIIGTATTIAYVGDIDQTVLNLNYRNLNIYSTVKCNKTLISDIVLLGNLQIGGGGGDVTFELSSYNLTVNGNLTLGGGNGGGRLRKSASGNVLFVGTMGLSANGIDFSGNPNVEMRGGGTFGGILNTGSGTWTFTTNNQSINVSSQTTADCNFIIGSGVTVNFFNNSPLILNKTINGTDSTSKLLMGGPTNSLYFATLESVSSMTTGTWDFTTNANTIGYTGNYTATIPSYFTTFHNLTISGTGTKSLGVNTTLNGNLSIAANALLECSTYNLSVTGTSTMSFPAGTLSKNGAGSLLFVGLCTLSGGVMTLNGNPNVEFRGGFGLSGATFTSGTGTFSFTTNNQTFTNNGTATFNGDVNIVGNISVTTDTAGTIIINGILNGTTANSTFINKQNLYFGNTTNPMLVGVLDYLTNSTSTIGYVMASNFTIPYATYNGLYIGGGVTTKTLSANTTINNNLVVNGGSILECSTFNLIVTGTTSINFATPNTGKLLKSGSGTMTFVGLCTLSGGQLNLTGNPNVEFRNGLSTSGAAITSGTGQWNFSTNNQSLTLSNTNVTFSNSFLISSITLTYTNSVSTIVLNGVINGDISTAKLLMAASSSLTYNASTKPMATGILDTSTNLNTWVYGNSNQDILGGPTTGAKQVYRNLTLNGGGTKTLTGYCSVLNTYTLTSPAVVNNNGFSITNP